MITNILVVPLSSLIIYIGILLLLVGSFPVISLCVAKILVFLIGFLNGSIHFIEELPFSTIKGIVINVWEILLLYVFFIGIILFFNSKRKIFLFISLTVIILLTGQGVKKKIDILERKKLIVYQLQQGTALEFIDQGKSILAGNQIFILNDFSTDIIQNTRMVLGYKEKLKLLIHPLITNPKPVISGIFIKKGNFIQFNGKKIGIINSALLPDTVSQKLRLDLLIIAENPKIKIADLMKVFIFREIVIDATNPAWKVRKWITEAKSLGISYYSVSGSGAFTMDF
jgi:competence protein ComEC